jgi:hypothetical protein
VKKDERVPGEFVTSVTVKEIVISTGIQLMEWAHAIAFTDAAFGQDWSLETADRMASLSLLLNRMFKGLSSAALSIRVDLPDGMVGQVQINPRFEPDAEKPRSNDKGNSDGIGGAEPSIDPFPF